MDKAGPFSVGIPVYLYFTIPSVSGAVIGDFSIVYMKNGAFITPHGLYLTNITSDVYHISNVAGGNPFLSNEDADVYLSITHTASGRNRLFHFLVSDEVAKESTLVVVDGNVDAIKLKTDNLPSDPADQSALETAITAATGPLATAASLTSLRTLVQRGLGLVFENAVLSDLVYEEQEDGNGVTVQCMTSATMTLYTDRTKAVVLVSYTITATYVASILQTYEMLINP